MIYMRENQNSDLFILSRELFVSVYYYCITVGVYMFSGIYNNYNRNNNIYIVVLYCCRKNIILTQYSLGTSENEDDDTAEFAEQELEKTTVLGYNSEHYRTNIEELQNT